MITNEDDPKREGVPDHHQELIRQAREQVEAISSGEGTQSIRSDVQLHQRDRLPPERVGPYKILKSIGEGGMGTVYLAEQTEPIHRKVALKLIKLGMDTEQVIARFDSERQALALMDHPNVAKMFDAGASDQGRPYFVMEYVPGIPITNYCDKHRLTTKERLTLFMQVCQAIQHAHQKGIIHRDIKPSNVLVTVKNDELIPKVIDFGVAKATQQKLTQQTLFTEQGQLVGTPEYMSPEQAEMTALNVDTRTDIYSLGVVLYELLAGELPFERSTLRKAAFGEMQRIIRDEEPPKPSTRLSSLGDEAGTVAKKRHTTRTALEKQLHGDLDWITMKAMEKDRTRRYATASEFADDIQRHLGNEPVYASPPSASYRLRKFVRRNKGPVAAVACVLIALTAGLITAIHFYIRAENAHTETVVERDRAVVAEQQQRTARKEADQASALQTEQRKIAEKLVDDTRRLLAKQYTDKGMRRVDDGDLLQSLVWFTEALKLDQVNPARAKIQRIRIAAVLRACPKLTKMSFNDHSEKLVKFSVRRASSVMIGFDARRVWQTDLPESVTLPFGLDTRVWPTSFSPDGRRIVTAGLDGARVWDATTGEPVTPPLGHLDGGNYGLFNKGMLWYGAANDFRVTQISHIDRINFLPTYSGPAAAYAGFSPDGLRVVTAGYNQTARVWDATTGEPVTPPLEHDGTVNYASFSPDGRRVVTASEDGTARVWNADTGEPVTPPLKHLSSVYHVEFSPDGRRVVTASDDRTAEVWDAATGKPITQPLKHDDAVSYASFSPDGRLVVTASDDHTARVWDATTGEPVTPPLKHGDSVWYASFGPDGSRVVTAARDGALRVWSLATGEPIGRHLKHSWGARHVSFSPDQKRIATEGYGETARVWDAATGEPVTPPLKHDDSWVYHVEFSPDGRRVVTASEDHTARVWDATTGELLTPALKHDNTVNDASFSPDGRRVVTASRDSTARVWDATTGEPVTPPLEHGRSVDFASFSPDGRLVVTASDDSTARVWDATTGEPVAPPLKHGGSVKYASFSPDGRRVVTASYDSTARVWDATTGEPVTPPLEHGGWVNYASFSPDGRRILTVSSDRTARVWNAATGKPVTPPLKYGLWWVECASFSPDGRLVVTASHFTARVWDAATGEPVTPILKHDSIVKNATFSPDGRSVLTAPEDGTVQVWNVSPDERSVDDLVQLAQLLASQRIDASGALEIVKTQTLHSIWDAMRLKHPSAFVAQP